MMRQTSMTWALGLWVTLTGWAGPLEYVAYTYYSDKEQ